MRCSVRWGRRGLLGNHKRDLYEANGAQLAWLLIPEQQALEVWPASGSGDPQRIKATTSLDAGAMFPGLRVELQEIRQV